MPPTMDGESATPEANHLFRINKDAEVLEASEAEVFHHYVAKLLFLCKHARPDIETGIAFLSNRVKAPDQNDRKKTMMHDKPPKNSQSYLNQVIQSKQVAGLMPLLLHIVT